MRSAIECKGLKGMNMTASTAYQASLESQISHELRIPLTGITGMVHFLSNTPLNAQQKKYLKTIELSVKRLLGLEKKLHIIVREKNRIA